MDGNGSAGNTPTGSTNEPDRCELCGATGASRFCNGMGFYDLDVPVGHPDFSKVFRCPNNPVDEDHSRQAKLRELSNLGAFADKTFSNFYVDTLNYSETMTNSLKSAYDNALRFARKEGLGWLVLSGTYGCGKTHLAAAIGNAWLQQGDMVLFVTAPDLLDYLRSSFQPGAESYNDTFERVRRANLLILDDLGVENPSEWSKEKLFQLLNYRYNEKLPTVITTNTDIDLLDPRLRSRMSDVNMVQHIPIDVPDYRTANRNYKKEISDLHVYGKYRFHNFDRHTNAVIDEEHNLNRALKVAQDFVRDGRGWLVFLGESGTGKTHLAAAIANAVSEQKIDVMFLTLADLMDYLRQTFSPSSPNTFDEQFQKVKDVPFLVLDDLTTIEASKTWAREKLLQIIKYRYVKEIPTVITSPTGLYDLDAQIRTRLMDRRLCHIFAINVRPYVERIRGSL